MVRRNIYKRWNVFGKAIGLSILLIIQISGGALGATPVTQCGSIGSSGEYVLDNDLWNTGNSAVANCITITSSDVVFDGASHFVVGNTAASSTIGVYVINETNSITNVTVKNLTLTNLDYGIYVRNSNGNNLTGINATNNSIGIYLENSDNNRLNSNTLYFNSLNGISIQSSNNNNIYDNYFNNTINVSTDSSANYWNTTKQSRKNIINGQYLGGNFWADPDGNGFSRTCAVSTIDGICDFPYVINANNKDFLPLTDLLPGVRYINGTVKEKGTPNGVAGVNVTISTGNYTLSNDIGFYSFIVTPGAFYLNATLEPAYYPNNSVTVSTGSSAVVVQDIELDKKPTGTISGSVMQYGIIRIDSPLSMLYNTTNIQLSVSADRAIDMWNYSLNGGDQVTFTPPVEITSQEGRNDLIVYAKDSAGNWYSGSVSFSVDSIPPMSVDNLHNVSYARDYINWTWTDPVDADFASVEVYLAGVYKEDVPKGVQFYNASGLEQATYTIGTRTKDINGTVNSTIREHTAATILPVERYINGTVTKKGTRDGIPSVTVSAAIPDISTMTNGTGFYSLLLTSGTFDLTAELEPGYYINSSVTVSTALRAVTVQDIELEIKPTGNISGSVTNV